MSPFLTCFPHLPYGKALRAGTHSARARKSTSSHYATRCVGAKKSQRTRNFVQNLVLGTRYGRRRCSSNSVFEGVSACIRTHNCEHSEQYNWRSQYNCRRQYNFLLARNITAKRGALQKKKRPLGSLCSFVVLIMLQRLRQRGNHLHMRHSRYIRLR